MAGAILTGDGDGDDDAPLVAINTTPLVDVMLVLLIIFLITMPVLSAAVPVDLPRQAAPRDQGDPVTVTIDRTGAVYWGDNRLDGPPALAALLTPGRAVALRGDAAAPFAAVQAVIDVCLEAGITRIGFVTDSSGGT